MATVQDLEEWISDSNDAFQISLLSPAEGGLRAVGNFQPKFTYSIFNEDEKILGYKNPKISLRYRANDMRPHVKFTYGKKMKPLGETEAMDVLAALKENHLPKVAFASESDFDDSSRHFSGDWTPPGQLHSSIETADGTYEIWKGSLADTAVKQLNTRVQIFVKMFIEGGSYIGERSEVDEESGEEVAKIDLSDADRWTLFFLYKKQPFSEDPTKHSYTFVGYSTVYRFYYFQPPTPPASPNGEWELPVEKTDFAELPCRTRLSQFVILPPFQGKGNGAHLYNAIFKHYWDHPQTREFTVEDPNEAFDDLRDACDLAFLRGLPEFNALSVNTDVRLPKKGPIPQLIRSGDQIEAIRQKAKIAPRQFARVLEMHLMSQLPESVRPTMELEAEPPAPSQADKYQEKLWQLVVKQRLYRHNKDLLSQIDVAERIDKLQETLGGVELEYARLLAAHDRAASHSKAKASAGPNGKRKLEEENGEESSKKAKVQEA